MENQLYKCKFCHFQAKKESKLYNHAISHNPDLTLEKFKLTLLDLFEPFEPSKPSSIITDTLFGEQSIIPFQVWDEQLKHPLFDSFNFDFWKSLHENINNFKIEDLEEPLYREENGILQYKEFQYTYNFILYDFYSDYVLQHGWELTSHYIETTNGAVPKSILRSLLRQTKIMFALRYNSFDDYISSDLMDYDFQGKKFIPVNYDTLFLYLKYSLSQNIGIEKITKDLATMLSHFDSLSEWVESEEHREETRNRINNFLLGIQARFKDIDYSFYEQFVENFNYICNVLNCFYSFNVDECLNRNGIELDWKYIDFFDGYIHLYLPKDYGEPNTKPIVLNVAKAKHAFNYIKDFIASNAPSPIVKIVNGKIVKITNLKELLKGINVLPKYSNSVFFHSSSKSISFISNISQDEIKERINKLNLESLNYLCAHQQKDFKLYYCPESRDYYDSHRYEDAFIFIVNKSDDRIIAIYENTNTNNASYQFVLKQDNLPILIELINSYFASQTLNKRECYWKLSNLISPYVISFRRIPHNGYEWKQKILGN